MCLYTDNTVQPYTDNMVQLYTDNMVRTWRQFLSALQNLSKSQIVTYSQRTSLVQKNIHLGSRRFLYYLLYVIFKRLSVSDLSKSQKGKRREKCAKRQRHKCCHLRNVAKTVQAYRACHSHSLDICQTFCLYEKKEHPSRTPNSRQFLRFILLYFLKDIPSIIGSRISVCTLIDPQCPDFHQTLLHLDS